MSVPRADFKVQINERDLYNSQARRTARDEIETGRNIDPGGGGLPWFGGGNSPTYPTGQGGYTNSGAPEAYEPPPDVGPQQPGGAGGAGGAFGGMSMAQLIQLLASAGVLGAGALGAGGTSGSGNTPPLDPALLEALNIQSGRMKKSEPLYDAILNMAGGLMPTMYQPRAGATSAAAPSGGSPYPNDPPTAPDEQPPAASRRY